MGSGEPLGMSWVRSWEKLEQREQEAFVVMMSRCWGPANCRVTGRLGKRAAAGEVKADEGLG